MSNYRKRIYIKKIIIAAICVIMVALAILGLTFTKYTTEEMRGSALYEPALFNTVLLGKLVSTDISELSVIAPDQYIVVDGEETYKQAVTGKKISTSITLNDEVEFGKNIKDGVFTDDSKIAPGSDDKNHGKIYFTITNGTTVIDDVGDTIKIQEEGKDPVTTTERSGKLKNVAESDIRYTIHIITTNNLPLEYKLIEILDDNDSDDSYVEYNLIDTLADDSTDADDGENAGTSSTSDNIVGTLSDDDDDDDDDSGTNTNTDDAGFQATSDYIVDNSTEEITEGEGDSAITTTKIKDGSVFVNGTRLLKCNDDGSITVHRYMLDVSWPSTGSRIINGNTIKNNDMVYMKEIENIEVRIEVESYVNHIQMADTGNSNAEGIMVIQDKPVYDRYYQLSSVTAASDPKDSPTYNDISSFSSKTVEFDNFKLVSSDDSPVTGCAKEYEYLLHICNGDTISAQWVSDDSDINNFEDSREGTSPTRASNGQSTMNGHYAYTNINQYNQVAGNYTVSMAVPTGNGGISKLDRSAAGNNYYIYYDNKLYTGVVEEDVVVTEIYDQEKDEETKSTSFNYHKKQVYKVIRFYNNGEILTLNMNEDGNFQCDDLSVRLGLATDITRNHDDFRLYITKVDVTQQESDQTE